MAERNLPSGTPAETPALQATPTPTLPLTAFPEEAHGRVTNETAVGPTTPLAGSPQGTRPMTNTSQIDTPQQLTPTSETSGTPQTGGTRNPPPLPQLPPGFLNSSLASSVTIGLPKPAAPSPSGSRPLQQLLRPYIDDLAALRLDRLRHERVFNQALAQYREMTNDLAAFVGRPFYPPEDVQQLTSETAKFFKGLRPLLQQLLTTVNANAHRMPPEAVTAATNLLTYTKTQWEAVQMYVRDLNRQTARTEDLQDYVDLQRHLNLTAAAVATAQNRELFLDHFFHSNWNMTPQTFNAQLKTFLESLLRPAEMGLFERSQLVLDLPSADEILRNYPTPPPVQFPDEPDFRLLGPTTDLKGKASSFQVKFATPDVRDALTFVEDDNVSTIAHLDTVQRPEMTSEGTRRVLPPIAHAKSTTVTSSGRQGRTPDKSTSATRPVSETQQRASRKRAASTVPSSSLTQQNWTVDGHKIVHPWKTIESVS